MVRQEAEIAWRADQRQGKEFNIDRLVLAYLIIAAMGAALAALVGFKLYFSRTRVDRRRRTRDEAAYRARMAAKAVDGSTAGPHGYRAAPRAEPGL